MSNYKNRKIDTKQQIRGALLDLLKENTYHNVTVKDIVSRIGLARQTFYLHYKDKESLFEEIIDDLTDGLIVLMKEIEQEGYDHLLELLTEPYHPTFAEFFRYMRRHSEDIITLIHTDEDTHFSQRFIGKINDFQKTRAAYIEEIIGDGQADTVRQMHGYVVHDLVTGLLQWTLGGMEPDEILMATHHTRMWISYILLSKDNWIYDLLVEKIKEKKQKLTEWMIFPLNS